MSETPYPITRVEATEMDSETAIDLHTSNLPRNIQNSFSQEKIEKPNDNDICKTHISHIGSLIEIARKEAA